MEVKTQKKGVWDDDDEPPDEKKEDDAGPELKDFNPETYSGQPRETESIASSSSKAAATHPDFEPLFGSVEEQQQK